MQSCKWLIHAGHCCHCLLPQGHAEIAELLLAAGADLTANVETGASPLHIAARRGHCTVLQTLLTAGADVHAVDLKKRTPLHAAAAAVNMNASTPGTCTRYTATQSDAAAALLLEWGASADVLDADGMSPLATALEAGNRNVVLALKQFAGEPCDDLVGTCTSGTDNIDAVQPQQQTVSEISKIQVTASSSRRRTLGDASNAVLVPASAAVRSKSSRPVTAPAAKLVAHLRAAKFERQAICS
jgi:ankyrin repeat protein